MIYVIIVFGSVFLLMYGVDLFLRGFVENANRFLNNTQPVVGKPKENK